MNDSRRMDAMCIQTSNVGIHLFIHIMKNQSVSYSVVYVSVGCFIAWIFDIWTVYLETGTKDICQEKAAFDTNILEE